MNKEQALQAAEEMYPIISEAEYAQDSDHYLIYDSYYDYESTRVAERKAFIAGWQSSQTPAALPVWVNGSERMPTINNDDIHYKVDGIKAEGYMLNDYQFEFSINNKRSVIEKGEFSRIEWYGEVLPSQLPSPVPVDNSVIELIEKQIKVGESISKTTSSAYGDGRIAGLKYCLGLIKENTK